MIDGRHQRRGRRRRRLKSIVITAVVIELFLTTSWAIFKAPEPEPKPTEQEIAIMRNLYRVSTGHNGDVRDFLTQWPEYENEIKGG